MPTAPTPASPEPSTLSSYNDKPILQAGCYSYFADLPVSGFETTIRPDRGWAALPTNDGLTLVVLGWPYAEHTAFKADVEGNFFRTLEMSPSFAERVRSATRVDRFHGSPVPNFFRKPYGPGWALVGDAGYTKDPITAQGISNAFRDAERCAEALDAAFAGRQPFEDAMASYQTDRDTHALPIYEFTTQLATLEAPPLELQQLLAGIHGNQAAMDGFVSITARDLVARRLLRPCLPLDPDVIASDERLTQSRTRSSPAGSVSAAVDFGTSGPALGCAGPYVGWEPAAERAVWSLGVVDDTELIELLLQLGDRGGCWLLGQPFLRRSGGTVRLCRCCCGL